MYCSPVMSYSVWVHVYVCAQYMYMCCTLDTLKCPLFMPICVYNCTPVHHKEWEK